ncbi:MAG: hypothetical protein EPN30_08170 [Actinomycetota bacterium]|nr:MAG: hypothetical protein EPN30_08170 [Actinomycetota bacterium]
MAVISDIKAYSSAALKEFSSRLNSALHLSVTPIGISFSDHQPDGIDLFDEPVVEASSDGRAGRVSAGCVFWMKATDSSFSTVAPDHGNCSVGSFTHGFVSFDDVAANSDIAELLGSGWVNADAVAVIPFVRRKYRFVTYGPLSQGSFMPDVVLLRLNGRQMMVVSDATGMSIEGKPQCHIIAVAMEQGRVVGSVGCALSRARTGMHPHEMTCAIPAKGLADVVTAIEKAADIDGGVAKYAASDARRFASEGS